MRDKLVAITSTITAFTAFWLAITALFKNLPFNFAELVQTHLPAAFKENFSGITLVMLALVAITIFLQFDKIQSNLLPRLDPFLLKFSGATATLNFLCLVLSAFVVVSMIKVSESQRQLAEQLQIQSISILESTSTRYLDTFPGNTEFIRDLYLSMNSPSDELVVILDYPSYGSYSALDNYLEIEESLKKAAVGFSANIRMCFYTEEQARRDSAHLNLINDISTPQFIAWKNHFHPTTPIETNEQYLAGLLDIDRKLISSLEQGTNFRAYPDLTEPPPIFLWLLKNKKTAVFSFPGQNETFRTSDVRLIEAFVRYSAQYCPE